MGRQKRSAPPDKVTSGGQHKPSTHMSPGKPKEELSLTRAGITIACLLLAGCIGFKGYLETRVNTKFDNDKMVSKTGLDVPDRYWGSYRPGLYFGMKTRDPYSLVSGLMWYFPRTVGTTGGGIRHWCEQGDNLDFYSWLEHDGRNFGVQKIEDGPFHITTSFIKRGGGNYGGDWTSKVSVYSSDPKLKREEVSLIFYVAIEEKTDGWIDPSFYNGKYITGIKGETSGLGSFKFTLFNQSGDVLNDSYLSTVAPGLHLLKETVMNSIRMIPEKGSVKKRFLLPGELLEQSDGTRASPNFVALQVTAKLPFEVTFVFESDSVKDRREILFGELYDRSLEKLRDEFSHKFEETFKLEEKGFDDTQINFAKAVLSNLIGGIGYFYGASRVQSSHTEGTVPYWKSPLYTAVPSRSFFPRGFLWDEGFHGLLISTWDLDIEFDIINHWFDLMNIEGWIPREQILGQEALSKVPEEFVTQQNTNANPPVFFLTLEFILRNFGNRLQKERKLSNLDRLFPRLQAWFDWFNVTQVGDLPATYRWRGRDSNTVRELNPKCLTSGLDDYPRASHPNPDERHIDLRCWIAASASAMANIADVLKRNGKRYENTFLYLKDNKLLDELHWSKRKERYCDFGLHTDNVVLKRPQPVQRHPGQHVPPPEKVRVVLRDPELRYVDSTFGYVSLFPFLLQLLDADNPKLGKLLSDIRNPELLWTEYGLRSLSPNSPLYMEYNTEHDPPYWRAPIWININYLAVRALHYYSKIEGPYSEEAGKIYKQLRVNLIRNIFKEYKRTGYVWEQYSDKTGEGRGSRPFTGWSSLVVLMMAEIY